MKGVVLPKYLYIGLTLWFITFYQLPANGTVHAKSDELTQVVDKKKRVSGLIVSTHKGREILIKENKKIKIWVNGKKPLVGRYHIINDSVISIREEQIPLSRINRISTVRTMVFLGMGATLIVAVGLYAGTSLFYWGAYGVGHWDIRYFIPAAPGAVFVYFFNKGKFPLIRKELNDRTTLSIVQIK
ncbi:MAG: hypothetical protein RLQ12_07690 [Cyclobacteriaceae bacterium]